MLKNDKLILKAKKRQLNTPGLQPNRKLQIFVEQKKNPQNNRPKSKNKVKKFEKNYNTQIDFYLKKNNNNNLKPMKLFNNNINNKNINVNKKNIKIDKDIFSEEKNNNKKKIFVLNNFDIKNKFENNIINVNNILSQSQKKKNSNLLQNNHIIINKLKQENNLKKNNKVLQNKINIIKIEDNKNKNLNDIFPKIKKIPKVKEHQIIIGKENNLNKINNKNHDLFDINIPINLKNNIQKKKIKVALSNEKNRENNNNNKKIFKEIININNHINPNFNKNIKYILKNPPIKQIENNYLINMNKNIFNNKENKLIFKLNINNNININNQISNAKSSDKFILKNNNNIFLNKNIHIQKNEFKKLKLRINSLNEEKQIINQGSGSDSKKEKENENKKEKENPILLKDYFCLEEINSRTQESMQDFTLIKHPFLNLDKHNLSLFCIFDGHGGDFVAKYLKENFASNLHDSIKINYSLNFHSILKSAFESMDKNLEKFEITQNCGSTATIVVIDNNNIYCANVGDSKCFYIDKNNAVQITEDHNCSNEKEKEELKKKGVIIFQNRIFGSLSLTRAFGDFEFKKEGITSIPYIKKIYLDKSDIKYIVIASDGIWDVVNKEKLFEIYQELKNGTSEEFCKHLVDYAINNGSNDNISCIILKF